MPVTMKGTPAATTLKQEIALAKQREVEVLSVFEKYDVDGSKTIEMDELTALLEDLGLLAELKTGTVEFAADMFNEFDKVPAGVPFFLFWHPPVSSLSLSLGRARSLMLSPWPWAIVAG